MYAPNIFVWEWKSAQMDWEYVFSVDGHVFRKEQILEWINNLHYTHPNSFEERMQECRNLDDIPPLAVCFTTSRLVNLPINRVQETHTNRCGNITSDILLEKWNNKLCIDISSYHQLMNKGVHEELELKFKDR